VPVHGGQEHNILHFFIDTWKDEVVLGVNS
jgi:hypothetical protein